LRKKIFKGNTSRIFINLLLGLFTLTILLLFSYYAQITNENFLKSIGGKFEQEGWFSFLFILSCISYMIYINTKLILMLVSNEKGLIIDDDSVIYFGKKIGDLKNIDEFVFVSTRGSSLKKYKGINVSRRSIFLRTYFKSPPNMRRKSKIVNIKPFIINDYQEIESFLKILNIKTSNALDEDTLQKYNK